MERSNPWARPVVDAIADEPLRGGRSEGVLDGAPLEVGQIGS